MKKAARFSIEILSLLLLMSHFLAGCSEEYGYNSEVAATESATPAPTIIDEDAAETVPSSGEELHMLTAQQGIAMTVGGETANGCYSLDPYPDASADIIYYDYLTQECIRLSADANLGHDPASTAYIPSFKGGARCFVVGDYLYVIKNGQPYTDASVSGNDPTARIYSMALDGSDRKIQEYGSNVVFNWFGGVAGNGTDALFTIVSIVDPQKAEVKSALVKFGRNLSGYEILYEWNDDVAEELGEIVKKETCSFKLYTAYDMMLDDGQIYEIFSRVKELGGIVGVHCENHGIVQSRLKELEKTKGRTDIADYSWIHPKEAEAEAVGRILKIAKCADVPVIIVNLSTAAGYREILKAREIGQTVYVETCPEYLLLNEEKYALAAEEARKYVTVPPLRKQKNSDILWDALKEGRIQTIASDHFGFTKEQKNAGEEDFMLTPSGMPGAEERPALMWQFGVNEGKITAEQMCAYLSENPAKLFKLYPWKGALIPGSDADIVIWNPNTEWTMTAADHQSACDYCLLEGAEIEGRAEQVYLRGKLVAENGKIIEEKTGMYIRHGVE